MSNVAFFWVIIIKSVGRSKRKTNADFHVRLNVARFRLHCLFSSMRIATLSCYIHNGIRTLLRNYKVEDTRTCNDRAEVVV